MLILGIDTATPQVGCAIGGHEGVIAECRLSRDRRHAETLVPAIRFLCERSGVGLREIGLVAVDVGPGLFTGLRVGLATAKGIAHGLGVPMIGIPSLDLVALPVRLTSRLIVAVVDARRGELYFAFYRSVPGGVQRTGEPRLGSPDDLAAEVLASGEEVLLVGDGAHRYREAFEGMSKVELADPSLSFPSAGSLVQLAHSQALREQFDRPSSIEPLYLRRPDAEINWSVRPGR